MTPRVQIVALALIALPAMLAVAGCGGGGSKHPESLAAARGRLVGSCVEGRTRDRALCTCIARELERHHGYDSAARFDRGRREVDANHEPSEIVAASVACGRKAAGR